MYGSTRQPPDSEKQTDKSYPMSIKDNVDAIRSAFFDTHQSQHNLSYQWRMKQLQQLLLLHKKHGDDIAEALHQDLRKHVAEATATETRQVAEEIKFVMSNLKKWIKPVAVPAPGHTIPSFNQVERRPLLAPGVLIIGPFNYPWLLTMMPLVGSLSGGNPAVLKPSELCPNVSALMAKLVPKYLDPGACQVMEGAIPETTELLSRQWGMVFFTGSERVGKIVAQAAAKTLTPVVLELGGKAPAIVCEDCPTVPMVAQRIAWAKTLNAGQTCVAVDYVLVHKSKTKDLCQELKKSLHTYFGSTPADIKASELSRIVTIPSTERHVRMIQECEAATNCGIVTGSSIECDPQDRFVIPTIVLNPPMTSVVMKEEIFGPILPLVEYETLEDAISFVQNMAGIPLALYTFTTSSAVHRRIIDSCPSGSAIRNDAVIQVSSSHLPFGGLGSSGYGSYHGKASFETFTHTFCNIYRPLFTGSDFGQLRCHPFGNGLKNWMAKNVFVGGLPTIPVLRPFYIAALLIAVAVALIVFVPVMGNGLAALLEAIADLVRH